MSDAGPEPGTRLEWRRTFTEDEIQRFTELSQDRSEHHVARDERGRLTAHGLLTATLPTKLGSDLRYIARTLELDFQRPVYAGEEMHCVGIVKSVEREAKRLAVRLSFTVTNPKGKTVLLGTSSGIIRR